MKGDMTKETKRNKVRKEIIQTENLRTNSGTSRPEDGGSKYL
jgi:hypothetical protein